MIFNLTAKKILNAEVRVGSSGNIAQNAVCGSRVTEDIETIDIICACGQPLSGRYVSVQLMGVTNKLTLCEVEVMVLTSDVIEPTTISPTSKISFF